MLAIEIGQRSKSQRRSSSGSSSPSRTGSIAAAEEGAVVKRGRVPREKEVVAEETVALGRSGAVPQPCTRKPLLQPPSSSLLLEATLQEASAKPSMRMRPLGAHE